MSNMINNDRMTKIISVVLTVVFGILLISLVVNAATTISGTAITLENGEIISNGTDGTIKLGIAGNVVQVLGTASSSAIKVGDESVPTINGLSFGYCTFSDTTVTASSTNFFDCTTSTANTLVSADRVFVQATSSFDTGFVIEAASTTGVSTINVRVRNISGHLGAPDTTLGGTSLNFWAVR